MSLRIEIQLPDNDVNRAGLAVHMQALGFTDGLVYAAPVVGHATDTQTQAALLSGETSTTAINEAPAEEKPKRGRKAKEDKPAITASPEHRVSPDDEKQDEADEQAEVEAARDPEKPLTIEDIRGVMGECAARYGMDVLAERGVELLTKAIGAPPEGEEFWKVTLMADFSQERLRLVRDAWQNVLDNDLWAQK